MSPTRPSTPARGPRAAARLFAGAAAIVALGACTPVAGPSWTNVFLPYRIEIVQGNVVTSDQLARINPGMSRVQVREALGTPLVADIFHADRWDYIFMINRGGTQLARLDVAVFFEGDKLVRVDAPALPTDSEFIDSINPLRTQRAIPVLALTPEQIKALPLPPPPTAAASAPDAPPRTYPPLEPSRG